MKKRQKPIALVTALVLFVLAAAGWNMYMTGNLRLPSSEDQPPRPTGQAPEPQKSDLTKAVQSSVATSGGPQATPKRMPGGPPGMPGSDRPKIELPKYTQTKPKPSDSSISGQWYQQDAMKDVKTGH